MFNPTSVVAASFGDYLAEIFTQHFSARRPEYATYLSGAARLVLERLGNTDALYHNAEHTMMVTLVGQQIMLVGFWQRKDAFHAIRVGDVIEFGAEHPQRLSDHLSVIESVKKIED